MEKRVTIERGFDDALNKRLLALLIDQPARILQLALATGMAVAQELVQRGELAELHRLGQSEKLCMSACAAILEQWVSASRAGRIDESDFQKLVDTIERIAKSS